MRTGDEGAAEAPRIVYIGGGVAAVINALIVLLGFVAPEMTGRVQYVDTVAGATDNTLAIGMMVSLLHVISWLLIVIALYYALRWGSLSLSRLGAVAGFVGAGAQALLPLFSIQEPTDSWIFLPASGIGVWLVISGYLMVKTGAISAPLGWVSMAFGVVYIVLPPLSTLALFSDSISLYLLVDAAWPVALLLNVLWALWMGVALLGLARRVGAEEYLGYGRVRRVRAGREASEDHKRSLRSE